MKKFLSVLTFKFLILSIFAFTQNLVFSADKSYLNSQNLKMQKIIQDPILKVKTLPNGFSIFFYKNVEPPKRVSMRLVVKRGSSTEKAGQEGLAHFTEHMAFNGTTNFPSGDMVEYFQRLGMAFGADTNAHTSFNETVFKIDLPSNDENLLNDGLKLFRDYADGILFEEGAIEKERGVIIAEKKSRDSASYRSAVELLANLFKGTVYENRMPIGLEDVIKNAPRQEFIDYYKSNYRPENMSLVVVGDADEAFVMNMAAKYFETMKADENFVGSISPKMKFDSISTEREFAFRTNDSGFKDSSASLYFVMDLFDECDSPKKRAFDLEFQVLSQILSMRFESKKSSKDSNYFYASADLGNFEKFANIFSISARANIGDSLKAMKNVEENWLSLRKFGVGEWELEKVKSEILNELESNLKAEKTRKTAPLSNNIASLVSEGEIVTNAQFDLDFAKEVLAKFDVKKASELINFIDANSKKVARFTDVKTPQNASENALSDFLSLKNEILKNGVKDLRLNGSELKFSEILDTGKVVSDKTEILGIREVAFANGVRLNLKKTDFSKEEIIINVSFGGGKFDLPKDNPALSEISAGFLLGGTAFQSYDEINLAKSDKQINYSFMADGGAFVLSANCTPKSLKDAIWLLATYFDSPAFSDSAMPYIEKVVSLKYRQLKTQPDSAMAYVSGWISGGNYMLNVPEFEDVKKCSMQDLKAWLLPIVKNSYMEISIVGDIDESETLELVRRTFASLNNREKVRKNYDAQKQITFTKERQKVIYVENSNDPRAIALGIWSTCGRNQIKKMRACNILGAVLGDELRKTVREDAGIAYSPFAYNNSNPNFDFGLMIAASEVVPENADELLSLIKKCAQKVSKNISQDEFERAKAPILKHVEKTRRQNSYWADSVMPLFQSESLKREIARTFETGYQEITLEDVKDASSKFLDNCDFYAVKILPKK